MSGAYFFKKTTHKIFDKNFADTMQYFYLIKNYFVTLTNKQLRATTRATN